MGRCKKRTKVVGLVGGRRELESRCRLAAAMALALRQFAIVVLVFVNLNHVRVSEAQPTEAPISALTLSIDCGATVAHTDNATGITWVPDGSYITTGLPSNNVTSSNSLHKTTLRYFPENQSKFCYVLPATNNTTYLVRTTFFGGVSPKHRTFQLQIDTSSVALITPDNNNSNWESVVEVVMLATGDEIDLCLAPATPGIDAPFINSIEVRQLAPNMYPKAREGYMMITSFRYNFGGGGQDIRYPNDTYDRVWLQYPGPRDAGSTNLTSSQPVVVDALHSRDSAPVAVMNTAMTWAKSSTFTLPFNVNGDRNYVVLLWFADIDNTSETREFVVGIDGNWMNPINILNVTGGKKFEAYEWGYRSIALSDNSYIALQATNTSHLGPILNAMEVYEVSDPVQPRTDIRDVAAIDAIKSQVWRNLHTWTGDPCLFLPYDWTSCSVDTTPRITKLELAGYNLTGSIPAAAIANFTELTVLSLANNSLHGSVPNLSALKNLQQLHLQNNNLTGTFPAWVANLTNLQELSVEGNSLTGYVPRSLFNRTDLIFTYTPRGLCTGSSPTAQCTALPEPVIPVAPPVASKSNSNSKMTIIIGTVAGVLGILILVCCICLLRWRPKLASSISSKKLLNADPEAAFACGTKYQILAYSFSEVQDVTNNFKNQISEGSFGPVYKGRLSDGREVAVKRCRPSNRLGFTEFFDEVEVLSRIHHTNLTSLLGFCQDEQEQILVYEYLSNSDLRTHLHGAGKHLPWSTRLAIALDAAQGIQYLHTCCYPSIIHRDVKPTKILLTRKMLAKVADFGFAKFTGEQDSQLEVYSADVKGSAGYHDPEYAVSGHLTDKSDVYGIGVVLLELVSGQEPIIKPTSDRNPLLIEWMRPLLAAGEIKTVVDPRLGENYNVECMWKVAELGMMCVEPRAFNRPTMSDVVEELRDAIAMEESAGAHHHVPPTDPSSDGPL